MLVGREREQGQLGKELAAALGGRGGLVLVGGEAGIGKTALVEDLARQAAARGALVLVGRCYDLSETPPYGPWLDLFGRYRAADGLPPLPASLARRGAIGEVTSQAALFAQVRDFLADVAARRPLVLLLDDQHWADPASLDLLRFLGRDLADAPLLLVATYRADELTRRHPLYQLLPLLVREAQATRVELRPLEREAVRALVAARYPLSEADEQRLVEYLAERAEGNPFFVGELLRTLEEERLLRALAPGGDRWSLGDLGRVPVPALLRHVIEGRLARLGEEARHLLALAAVIGQELPLGLWAAVADAEEEALLGVVERAVDARVLEEVPDGAGVRFAHALIREALYEGTLGPRRRAWHRRVGEALLAQAAPDPDAVAYHLRQAGDPRAAEWLVRAGERARHAYAWLTAVERYEAALALLGDDAAQAGERGWLLLLLAMVRSVADPRQAMAALDEAARLAAAVGDRALAAFTLFVQGALLGDRQQALETLEAGAAAVEALPPEERARLTRWVAPRGGAAFQLNSYWGTLVVRRAWAGRYAEALALGERVVARLPAPSAGPGLDYLSAWFVCDAYLGLGVAHAMLGRPAAAQRAFAEARAAAHLVANPFLLGAVTEQELKLLALAYRPEQVVARRRLAAEVAEALGRAGSMGMVTPRLFCVPLLVLEGAWAEARALALTGRTAGHNAGVRELAMGALGWLAREQGEPELAWAQVREVLPDGPATTPGSHFIGLEAPPLARLAAALAVDAGDPAMARAWLEMHDRWLAWSGAVLGQAAGQLGWAAYHRAAGDLAPAREHAGRALAGASEPRQPLALLAAHRFLGELDTAAGQHAEAQVHLDHALALAEACAAPYERALTLLALAELRAATGDAPGARALLEEACTICTPLGAQPALARAEALEARLAAPTPTAASPAYPAGLTAREVEVLRLVAQGLSDAEVAARLYISVHTVKTHLRATYGKLAVASRSAATRVALEYGLA